MTVLHTPTRCVDGCLRLARAIRCRETLAVYDPENAGPIIKATVYAGN